MLFYNLILKIGKRKEEHDTLLRKKTKEKQSSATIMISSDDEITKGIVCLKILKERISKNIQWV